MLAHKSHPWRTMVLILGAVLMASAAIQKCLDPVGNMIIARLKTREEALSALVQMSRFHKTLLPAPRSARFIHQPSIPEKGAKFAEQPVRVSSVLRPTNLVLDTNRIPPLNPSLHCP